MGKVRVKADWISEQCGEVRDCASRLGIRAGGFVEFSPEAWMEVLAVWRPWGLGTLVYEAAHPAAQVMDAALGTHLSGCGGCAERMGRWNGLPDGIAGGPGQAGSKA